MIMNFSPYIFVISEKYMSNDEKEIQEEIEKVERENVNEPISKL